MSTKGKTLLFVGVVFGTFLLILIGAIYLDQKNKLEAIQNSYYSSLKQSYEKILHKHQEFYYNRTLANINSKGVIETFSLHERQKLFALTEGRWKTLQKENRYLNVMHFHLPDGTTFLRMHKPEHFGDNVASFRPMIAQIHKTHEAVRGFEMGRQGLAFRTAAPIFKEGQYIGALEFGSKPEQILHDMKYYNNLYGALFVKANKVSQKPIEASVEVKGYRLQYNALENPALLPALLSTSYVFAPIQTFTHEERTYNVYAFDLYDFEEEVTAKAIFFQDITPIIDDFRSTIVRLILLVSGLFGLVLVVINFGFRKIVSQLDESNAELKTILATSKDGIAILDLKSNFLYANHAYLDMTGFTMEELLKKSCAGLSASEDLPRAIKVLEEVKEKGFVENFEKTCIVKNDKRIMINMAIAMMPDNQRLLITTKNITEAKKIEKEMRKYIELIDENIITSSTDLNGDITYSSAAFSAISGYSKEELIGQNHRIVRHPDMTEEIYKEMWGQITNDQIWEGEIKNLTKEGGYYWVQAKIYPVYNEVGEKYGYTAIRTDITDKKRVEEISITDALTGIYNRRYFNDIFPKYLKSAKRNDELACFILMDVDHFKLYNDTYGHQMGDDVLIRVAQRIKNSLQRADDYCFRLGGEEFGVLFKSKSKEGAALFAETLRQNIEALEITHEKNSASRYITASMGMVVLDGTMELTCDMIYKRSDELLYRAKESGRNRVCEASCEDKGE